MGTPHLASPRRYYFDPREKKLYYNPNSTTAGPTGDEAWVATKTRVLMNVSGAMGAPVRNVSVLGMRLVDTRQTYLDVHGMPSGGGAGRDSNHRVLHTRPSQRCM
jgi:hypothetical protein